VIPLQRGVSVAALLALTFGVCVYLLYVIRHPERF